MKPVRWLTALATAAAMLPAVAFADTPIKVVLNWKYQGPQAWFFVAQDKGYFKAEGLDVTIDQGEGSAASITKVAAGAYQAGFGDINAVIDLAAKRPADAPVAVYMLYNTPPFTIVVKKDSPIRTAKDLEGKTLGAPANDGALKLFPAFAKAAKVDPSKVSISNMAPNLREQMLMRGQVDGVFGYINTIAFSARLVGLDPEKDLRFINYGDNGLDLYSNAVVFSRAFVKENPKAVTGFLKALNRAINDSLANPEMAMDSVMKREPLLKRDIERDRLAATLKDEMNHPEIAKIGLGDIDTARLTRSIGVVVEANQLARTPTAAEVFDRSFLPARADRASKL
ncbi:ABC transporter substrate-binding protein [Piscinibacter gummiphilus]|uniref:ABC transporter substrate-binding protein n=1 Tax=Piscinibacter gummiphilus TaxID=946333 RepID=A0A1W6L3A1_9BURK|nr:ABC transporter substrate-binding protein [Piscinibacter gummiphilus]ARN18754.1 ABC transporter substrate-binding protein [Piscinibacter gummiphilus]ATU63395.1 ABC transporter substrate-binding protein [Piscinibacter gummiphilus]GLS95907.1 ABC transporter substrate-binding protein [Piscinibacter gummiphilus]